MQIKKGLSSSAYVDKKFWEKECQTIFKNSWVFVGFKHEINNPGDVNPITVAKQPILLVNNNEGNISAFHNVCSHRCIKLIDTKKNTKKIITCPYHAWAYDLDGNLIASPHFGGTNNHKPEGFDRNKHGLRSVRIKVWYDWIFININNNALDFDTYAKPLIDQFKDTNLEKICPVATLEFGEIKTNWKFLIENFIEPYHVQFVHKKTTSQPLKDHYTIVNGLCYGSGVDMKEEDSSSGNLAVTSKYLSLFPNFIIGTYFPGQLGVYLNTPIDLDKTSQKRVIYTTEGNELTKNEIEQQKDLWWKVHKEDHEICERLQLGRLSPIAIDGGLLSSHWEDGVSTFQDLVIKNIKKPEIKKKEYNYV